MQRVQYPAAIINIKIITKMKKILIFITLLIFGIVAFAQAPVASKQRTKAVYEYDKITYNTGYADTLKSNDTIAFVFLVNHKNTVAFCDQSEFKLVAADTTVTITYWQSNDKVKWHAVYAGASPSAYTKAITATNSGNAFYDSKQDVVYFNAQYLMKRYISKTKTGFKTIPIGSLKFSQNN